MKTTIVLGLAAILPAIPSESTLIPREELFRQSPCMAIKISPNSKQLAFVGADRDGTMNLYLSSYNSIEGARQVTYFTEPEIKGFYWSADSNKILLLKDKDGTRQFRLYLFDIQTAELKDLTAAYQQVDTKVFEVSKTANKAVIGINLRHPTIPDLYLLDMETGDLKLMYENDHCINFLFDDRLQIAIKVKMNEDSSLAVLDNNDRQLFSINAEDAFHTEFLRYIPKEKILYFLDNRNTDTTQLKKISLVKFQETCLGHDSRSDIADVVFAGDEIIAYANYYTQKEWHALNPKAKKELDFLISKLGSNFTIGNQSADGKYWIINNDIPEKGMEFWLYNRKLNQMTLLYSYPESGAQSKMYPVIIPSQDGLNLVSYLTLPKNMDLGGHPSRPLPLIIIPHGGPFKIRDWYSYCPDHQWLADRGYAVLSVNFRMSAGFGKSFVKAGYSQWGKKAHQDILDAIQWCIKNKIAAEGKIAVYGGSYGGYVALSALTFTPDDFSCAVSICGPSNLRTALEKALFYWEFPAAPLSDKIVFFTKNAFVKTIGGDPDNEKDLEHIASCSPINYVDKITKPLLLIHGANDPIVKASESDQIFQTMQQKNLPVLYISFSDEGHGVSKFSNSMCFLAYTEWFLAEMLGGNYQPITEDEIQKSSASIQTCGIDPEAVKIDK